MSDPYRVLGLEPGASEDEVKRAFRRLAREHHPDHNPGDAGAAERFKRLRAAYDQLRGGDTPGVEVGRVRPRAGPDDDWLDGCAWMAEARFAAVRASALPRFVQTHGVGPELLFALAEVAELGLDEGKPEARAGWWARQRSRWLLRRVSLEVRDNTWSVRSPISLDWRDGQARLVLTPLTLWRQGIREDEVLRPVVQRAVDIGLVSALGVVLGLPRMPRSAEEAAELHRPWLISRWLWTAIWAGVFVLIVAMTVGVYAGW